MGNEEKLKEILIAIGKEYGLSLTPNDVVLERSKDPAHGDYATNLALRFGKSLGKNPRAFAAEFAEKISDPSIDKVEVAGPGFINFFLHADAMTTVLSEVFRLGENYGRRPSKGKKVNVEFFSANPTGDIHLGHTRIGAFGDSLAETLIWAGYDVTREYYVNDCGNQVEHLGNSLRARYHELYGEPLVLGDDDYHGVDLIDIAKSIREEYGDKYLVDNQESHDFFIRYGIDAELKKIKAELTNFRIHFDKFSYESEIRKDNRIEKTIEDLREYTYQSEGATYLRTTAFLDDKDRPIVKSNGCVLFILHKDRDGLIQRLAYGPIGSYINMVWMDVRYDVIIDTIQNFLRRPRQSINRHGNFHFNRVRNHVWLPRNISETTKASFSTKPGVN